jgi:signal peptidase
MATTFAPELRTAGPIGQRAQEGTAKTRRWPRAIRSSAVAIGWFVAVLFAALLIVPALFGLDRYVIVSGSMHPVLDRGSIVFSRSEPVEDLQVGDVITYSPPPDSGVNHLVTHRISEITTAEDGSRLYRTKGDANPGEDPWTFQLVQDQQNVMAFSVPFVGHLLIALSNPRTRMLIIGIPAGLIALQALLELVGIDLRRRPATSATA